MVKLLRVLSAMVLGVALHFGERVEVTASDQPCPASGIETPQPLLATVRSYNTGGVTVLHNQADEGRYYDTPSSEVAYALSVLRTAGDKYVTIYHGEQSTVPVGTW